VDILETVFIVPIVVAFVFLVLLGVYFTRYQTSGPNEALIVTGRTTFFKTKKAFQ